MSDVLPAQSGLTIGDVFYRYTIEKDPLTNGTVTVRNSNPINGGYIFSETDDWSGKPGATINKLIPFPAPISKEYWGDGEILVQGDGNILNSTVVYGYRYDTCFNPLSSSDCPGFENALYDWLKENGMLESAEYYDPFYSSEVQDVLDDKYKEDDDKYKEENVQYVEEDKRRKLLGDNNALMAEAATVAAEFDALAMMPKFEQYYEFKIDGKEYNDVVKLEDGTINDNRRAFGSLVNDSKFNEIVESQYNR